MAGTWGWGVGCVAVVAVTWMFTCAIASAQTLAGYGACRAAGASGGLIGTGGATSLLEALSGAAAGTAPCLPTEPASLPLDAPSRYAGNPVDLATGEKVDRAIDAQVGGTSRDGAFVWGFSRLYGSASAGSVAFGPGWRHGFETRLHVVSGAAPERVPVVQQADGRQVRFRRVALPVQSGTTVEAEDPRDGALEFTRDAGVTEWVWRWPSGRVLYFAPDGRLRRIQSEQGWSLALTYDVAGRLVMVSDTGARALTLIYGPSAGGERLRQIHGAGVGSVEYRYDASGRLAEVRQDDGRFVRYRYAEPGSARLAGLELEDGRFAAYRYDAQGRVRWSLAAGDREPMVFAYEAGQDAGETRVSIAGVQRGAYRWRLLAGVPQLVEADGVGCARCPPTGLRYGYDGGAIGWVERSGSRWSLKRDARAGVLRVTAPNGVIVRYRFDGGGRVVALDSPDHGPVRKFHDALGRLSREVAADGTTAIYRYAESGMLRERVMRAPGEPEVRTRYRHDGLRLAAIEHPEQSETLAHDVRGRLAERTVRLRLASGVDRSYSTRYRYASDTGALMASSLPDGSWLHYVHDATGQILALRRVSSAASNLTDEHAGMDSQTLVGNLARGRHGLSVARFGNGVTMRTTHGPDGKPVTLCHSAQAGDCSVLDHALDFDHRDRLTRWRRGEAWSRFLFDEKGALLQAEIPAAGGTDMLRYAYDANGNRLLSQEGSREGSAVMARTHPGTNRIAMTAPRDAGTPVRLHWDASGRLLGDGRRAYQWRGDGLLRAVLEGGRTIARYRYNHRGERIAKWSPGGGWRYFLHDASRRVVAELDADGRLRRQYLYLADLPVAVLDHDGDRERLTYLHLNHLGAPEAATSSSGRVVWRAGYRPFGRRVPESGKSLTPVAFEMPLRLPGQYEDTETGLHHNDHRYYDPDTGRYLSPDPLGLRGGPNPYVYAANDPLTRIDPTGLLLFAFDGTGNSEQPSGSDDWSNVYKLARSYDDGRVWYVGGVGTGEGGVLDTITAGSARARVDRMLAQLDGFSNSSEARGRWFDIDVIGFSRGAAMGRDFANRVAARIDAGDYRRLGACLRLRFLGLWDTVAQFGINGALDLAWRLAIPQSVAYAAHAVALNEHRILFPVESIAGSSLGGVRIERGFVGAHADVGGSYAEGDLSDVALGWMHAQARTAGVRMRELPSEYRRVTSPLLHDSNTSGFGDREFRQRSAWGLVASSQWQRLARVDGLQWRDTAQWITGYPQPRPDAYGERTLAGEVDIAAYSAWLRVHYGVDTWAGP